MGSHGGNMITLAARALASGSIGFAASRRSPAWLLIAGLALLGSVFLSATHASAQPQSLRPDVAVAKVLDTINTGSDAIRLAPD